MAKSPPLRIGEPIIDVLEHSRISTPPDQIGPGFVDYVHWEGSGLVATSTAETSGARLVPISENAFSPDGVAPLIVFERDASGRVAGYVQGSPDGVVRRAQRIP